MSAMKPARNVSVRFLPQTEAAPTASAAPRASAPAVPRSPPAKRRGPSLMSQAVLCLVLVSLLAGMFV